MQWRVRVFMRAHMPGAEPVVEMLCVMKITDLEAIRKICSGLLGSLHALMPEAQPVVPVVEMLGVITD